MHVFVPIQVEVSRPITCYLMLHFFGLSFFFFFLMVLDVLHPFLVQISLLFYLHQQLGAKEKVKYKPVRLLLVGLMWGTSSTFD